MSSDGSDPLANTVLASATADSGKPPPADPPPKTIGRYKIEGVLGQGAMGTVYAAHDVDLERRIALKILRGAGSEAARARLLREARAMARLSHPAVVTVHEVGTSAGVDYVAMELIDGATVAEWMRAEPRPPAPDVLAVFATAGRGLAAAHAAGLIHRDFKPHNVLRSKRGRVVVTDFGLARAMLDDDATETALDADARASALASGSLSSTLTATGALLGTPAYMAPEQHDGRAAGPAADQFAFCVALWEGLAGARPFAGDTLGELRTAIARGPDPATEARLPRRLRGALRRGLAIDPAARWPSMDALLDAIAIRRRAPYVVGAVVVAAAIGAVAMKVATGGPTAPAAVASGCGSAAAELAGYRTGPRRAALAAAGRDGARTAAALDRRADEWAAIQAQVCAATADPARAARLTCLAAVRGDLEVAAIAAADIPDQLADHDAVSVVPDPSACAATPPPMRIVPVIDTELIELTRLAISDDAPAMSPPPQAEACRNARWLMITLDNPLGTLSGYPDDLGEACRDDYMLATIAVARAAHGALTLFGNNPYARPAERALARAGGDRYLAAKLAITVVGPQLVLGDLDAAITAADTALAGLATTGADASAHEIATDVVPDLLRRGRPADLARAEQLARQVLADADPDPASDSRRDATLQVARVVWARGALADAHALADAPDRHGTGSTRITGRVIGPDGAAVAGARVAAAPDLLADAVGLDAALEGKAATAITGADGGFVLTGVEDDAMLVAEHGEQRSRPVAAVSGLDVALGPTGTVTGHIDFDPAGGAIELHMVPVELAPQRYSLLDFLHPGPQHVAVLAPDGSFTFSRLPYGKYILTAATPLLSRARTEHVVVAVGPTPSAPVAMSVVQTGDPVTVLVRTEVVGGFSGGMAFALRGTVKPAPKTFGDLGTSNITSSVVRVGLKSDMLETFARPLASNAPPPAGYVDGDAVGQFVAVEPGPATICAVGINGDLLDLSFIRTMKDHLNDLELGCVYVTIKDRDQVVVVDAPAMKRFP